MSMVGRRWYCMPTLLRDVGMAPIVGPRSSILVLDFSDRTSPTEAVRAETRV